MSHSSAGFSLPEALEHAGVIVCAGTGGVGKTTLAASLALRAPCTRLEVHDSVVNQYTAVRFSFVKISPFLGSRMKATLSLFE